MPSIIRLPRRERNPFLRLALRLAGVLLLVLATALIVLAERDQYRDATGSPLSFLDCLYYATVSLSTTGYGDIVPVTPEARLVTVLVITPLRILFLIILVGATIAVLTERGREQLRIRTWRSRVRDHTVICGFGTKGQAAAQTLLAHGVPARQIVAVDQHPEMIQAALALGLVAVTGDASRSATLNEAEVHRAAAVIVTPNRDDTSVLVTLTARQLNAQVPISAACREEENAALLQQGGAETVVTSSAAAGRLLGLSAQSPRAAQVAQDLFSYGNGLDLRERPVVANEVGQGPRDLEDIVVGVVRDGAMLPPQAMRTTTLRTGDRVLYISTDNN